MCRTETTPWVLYRNQRRPESGESGSRTMIARDQSPVQRTPNDLIISYKLPLSMLATLVIPSMIHSAIHLVAWNLAFPSEIENALWKMSGIILASVSCFSIGLVRRLIMIGYQGKYNLSWLWVYARRKSFTEGSLARHM
ncbi:hypothetical protein F5X99DRAFT_232730 [Biscogniauxia marginata]|nr:hypothetical protein F5X99DRAFT_232730 [Biscogniauxia marginata]